MIPDSLLLPVIAFAASYGGVRMSLNGTKKRVETIDTTVGKIDEKVNDVNVRLGRVEGKLGVEHADSSK